MIFFLKIIVMNYELSFVLTIVLPSQFFWPSARLANQEQSQPKRVDVFSNHVSLWEDLLDHSYVLMVVVHRWCLGDVPNLHRRFRLPEKNKIVRSSFWNTFLLRYLIQSEFVGLQMNNMRLINWNGAIQWTLTRRIFIDHAKFRLWNSFRWFSLTNKHNLYVNNSWKWLPWSVLSPGAREIFGTSASLSFFSSSSSSLNKSTNNIESTWKTSWFVLTAVLVRLQHSNWLKLENHLHRSSPKSCRYHCQ